MEQNYNNNVANAYNKIYHNSGCQCDAHYNDTTMSPLHKTKKQSNDGTMIQMSMLTCKKKTIQATSDNGCTK